MKLSWNWLRSFVDIADITPEEVGRKLTLHTAELEEIIPLAPFYEKVYAGELVNFKKHPEAEKLHIGTFNLGMHGTKQIIFGSVHEVAKGTVYPIALAGARLKSGIEIKDSEIRGQKSEGMICDNNELGFKNSNLLTFSKKDIGKLLPEISKEFKDYIFDIDNKSLTHRPDLMGHRGFAREIAAIFDRKLTLPEPVVMLPKKGKPLSLKIETAVCSRFCAIKISGVEVQPSDISTQIRLENLGIRAISNVVDITNWILLEFGQPMHAFDAEKVHGDLIIRQAKKGEKLIALDEVEYELTSDHTVVADEKIPLSVAGIMGGKDSGVRENTKNVILECAHWDPTVVRKTSYHLSLRSESSMRYEKSLDPMSCRPAILASCEKLLDFCPDAKIVSPLQDEFPAPPKQLQIKLNPELVRKLSGINMSDDEISRKLRSIGFSVSSEKKIFQVAVPSFRATKDVSIPEDLIEEVVRLHGFEDIQACLPVLPIIPPKRNILRELEWEAKEYLAARGFLETYNYSLVNEKEETFIASTKETIRVQNPLSEEQAHLRQTLVFGLLNNIESDLRTYNEVNFYEFGKVFKAIDKHKTSETLHLGLLKASLSHDENTLFYELKKDLNRLFLQFGITPSFIPSEGVQYCHPSKTAAISIGKENIGKIAVLHPRNIPVKNAGVVLSEINIEKLVNLYKKQKQKKYQKLSLFPPVFRDLSLIVPSRTLISDIESIVYQSSDILQKIELFDEFVDECKIGKGLKNLAFHLEFRSPEKTLEEHEIEEGFYVIVKSLEKVLKAQLRLDFEQGKVSA